MQNLFAARRPSMKDVEFIRPCGALQAKKPAAYALVSRARRFRISMPRSSVSRPAA